MSILRTDKATIGTGKASKEGPEAVMYDQILKASRPDDSECIGYSPFKIK